MKLVVPVPAMTIRHDVDSDLVVGMRIEYQEEGQIQAILEALERRIYIEQGRAGLDPSTPGLCLVGIVMPCGYRYIFHGRDDLPETSMPCGCGRDGHWVVLYDRVSQLASPAAIWP